jgi:hypothetical protein
MSRRILQAAILQDCIVWTVARPGRHPDVIRLMVKSGVPAPIVGIQGFITNDGDFHMRRKALMIARREGQLLKPDEKRDGDELFSEDVW